jgi:hypothetical protein
VSRGHNARRRRNYGKRQRDLRDRRGTPLDVGLDVPAHWPRGAAWEQVVTERRSGTPPEPRSVTTDPATRPAG